MEKVVLSKEQARSFSLLIYRDINSYIQENSQEYENFKQMEETEINKRKK